LFCLGFVVQDTIIALASRRFLVYHGIDEDYVYKRKSSPMQDFLSYSKFL